MKNENTAAWAADLHTTSAPQVRSNLAAPVPSGVIGYCCLGRGCEVAGIKGVPDVDASGNDVLSYDGAKGLPPKEFARWLGFSEAAINRLITNEVSVCIDWPEDLADQCSYHDDACDGNRDVNCYSTEYRHDENTYSCAQLNDVLQLTFDQIGDLVGYFGVKL